MIQFIIFSIQIWISALSFLSSNYYGMVLYSLLSLYLYIQTLWIKWWINSFNLGCVETKYLNNFYIRIIIYDVSKYIYIVGCIISKYFKEIIIILSFTDTRIYSNMYYMQIYWNISMLTHAIYIPIS